MENMVRGILIALLFFISWCFVIFREKLAKIGKHEKNLKWAHREITLCIIAATIFLFFIIFMMLNVFLSERVSMDLFLTILTAAGIYALLLSIIPLAKDRLKISIKKYIPKK